MNMKFAFSILALSLSGTALSGVKVTSVDLSTNSKNGIVNITLDGRSTDLPDIKVNGKIIEVTLSNADAFNSIQKNVKGTQIFANSLNGKALIKTVLPYEVAADAVNVGFKNSNIEVVFPRAKVHSAKKEAKVESKVQTGPAVIANNNIAKEALNEDYLNNLMNDENAPTPNTAPDARADEVKVKQAAIAKIETKVPTQNANVPKASTSSDNFSFAGYAVKFSLFLGLVLGLFYGVVQLLKKGVFSKGKLSFLNNTKMIEVLSTTYIAPKRSLMIVKAHKQIFLVANSESGLTFLSEMTDTSGLMKEGEKLITGTNFDTNLGSAEDKEEAEMLVKLKENIMESSPIKEEKGLSKMAVAKDIVKFSDELKKKAKKLKPIEFN